MERSAPRPARRPRRSPGVLLAVPAVGLGLLLAGCGGGGSASGAGTPTTAGGPAANIDPNSHNVITGPINQARTTASSVDQSQDQMGQIPGGN